MPFGYQHTMCKLFLLLITICYNYLNKDFSWIPSTRKLKLMALNQTPHLNNHCYSVEKSELKKIS